MKFLGEPTGLAPGLRSVYGRDPFGNVVELEEAVGRIVASESSLLTGKTGLYPDLPTNESR